MENKIINIGEAGSKSKRFGLKPEAVFNFLCLVILLANLWKVVDGFPELWRWMYSPYLLRYFLIIIGTVLQYVLRNSLTRKEAVLPAVLFCTAEFCTIVGVFIKIIVSPDQVGMMDAAISLVLFSSAIAFVIVPVYELITGSVRKSHSKWCNISAIIIAIGCLFPWHIIFETTHVGLQYSLPLTLAVSLPMVLLSKVIRKVGEDEPK